MTKQQVLNEWNVEVNENDEVAFTTTVKCRRFPLQKVKLEK
jgi:hypothetical protein